MATRPSREPIPPERVMVLASRRETRGSGAGWLAALSMVMGIAVASILLRSWPVHVPPLQTMSRAVALMHAPAAWGSEVTEATGPTAKIQSGTSEVRPGETNPPAADVPGAFPVSSPTEEPRAAVSIAEAVSELPIPEIAVRPVTFVTMVGPALEPEGLMAVEPRAADLPFGVAAPRLVARAMLAAGRGIATGVKLTGASIRSAF